jgi:hypothetical protein
LHANLLGHSLTFDAVLNSECPPAAGTELEILARTPPSEATPA